MTLQQLQEKIEKEAETILKTVGSSSALMDDEWKEHATGYIVYKLQEFCEEAYEAGLDAEDK